MMTSRIILALLATIACHGSVAQQPLLVIDSKADAITMDPLGNYFTTMGSAVSKFDSNGKWVSVYDVKKFGAVTSVDASNPFKVLVFHKDFLQLVFLDNKLTARTHINIIDLGISQPTLACTANNDQFWIYDSQTFRLTKFNNLLEKTLESVRLNSLLEKDFRPTAMIEQNEQLYVLEEGIGLLVFDKYASYLKTIPLKKAISFVIEDTGIRSVSMGEITYYDFRNLQESVVQQNLPDQNSKHFIFRNKLICLTEKNIKIYEL